MNADDLSTNNPRLVPKSLADVRAMIEAMNADKKAQLSADWLAMLHGRRPLIRGFTGSR